MTETVTVTLRHGLKLDAAIQREAELRESFAEDLFAAEQDASAENPLSFNGALIARQLVRIGTYKGPFTVEMLGKLKSVDYGILRAAQLEVDALGEVEQEDSADS